MSVGERSFADILQEIVGSIRQILRLELQLVKVEVSASLLSARQAMVVLVASTFALLFAVGCLLLAAIDALSLVMAPWAAALTVGGVMALAGLIGIVVTLQKFHQVHLPKRTIASLQETML